MRHWLKKVNKKPKPLRQLVQLSGNEAGGSLFACNAGCSPLVRSRSRGRPHTSEKVKKYGWSKKKYIRKEWERKTWLRDSFSYAIYYGEEWNERLRKWVKPTEGKNSYKEVSKSGESNAGLKIPLFISSSRTATLFYTALQVIFQ